MCIHKYDFLEVKRAGKVSNLYLSKIMTRSILKFVILSKSSSLGIMVWSTDMQYACISTRSHHTYTLE